MEDNWISVEDSLPDYNTKVLVWGEERGMNPQMGGSYVSITRRFSAEDGKKILFPSRSLDNNGFRGMSYVTHWMPIPKGPLKK